MLFDEDGAKALDKPKHGLKVENGSAFASLMEAMTRDDTVGQNCFDRIMKHQTEDYLQGNFKTAWLELVTLNENTDTKAKVALKNSLQGRILELDEHPSFFMTFMLTGRKKPQDDFEEKVPDHEFLVDMLQ